MAEPLSPDRIDTAREGDLSRATVYLGNVAVHTTEPCQSDTAAIDAGMAWLETHYADLVRDALGLS
jgi:hypothetical protein